MNNSNETAVRPLSRTHVRPLWHAKVGRRAIALALATWVLSSVATAQRGNTLYEFMGGSDGGGPYAGLTMDAVGNLYGTTASYGGGACDFGNPGCGTVFELVRSGGLWQFKVLHTFEGCLDGDGPSGSLVFDPQGNLYGTTGAGGSDCGSPGYGTVFELKPSAEGWEENILYRFRGESDGSAPGGPLALDSEGNIFGTAAAGGDRNCSCGVVFELKRLSNISQQWEQRTEVVLHTFVGSDGANPASGVTLAPSKFCQGGLPGGGCIFGTAPDTGDGWPAGVVFQLLPTSDSSWTFRVLHMFQSLDGRPGGPLVLDKTGALYGMAGLAGAFSDGAVFELKPTGATGVGWNFSYIYSFRGPPDGWSSWYQGVTWDKAGNLYGTTSSGGTSAECVGGCGTVFRLSRVGETWIENGLYSLPGGSDAGAEPFAGVAIDANGNIYGTTVIGGDLNCSLQGFGQESGCGVVFQVSP